MGEASTTAEDGDDGGHGPSIGVAIGLNVVINALINAGFGYGIAWLHWQDYTLSWYTHELHRVFELDFVVEDVIVQGISVGVIVTLIVAAILHRQWDGDHLQAGRIDRFLLEEERTRGRHLAAWAGSMGLMGFAVSIGIVALLASGVDDVSGSTFALARTVNGFVVGGLAGGFVTASWVTNLSAGKLVQDEGADTVVARTMRRASARPWVVLGLVALVTAGLGAGVTDLDVNVNESDELTRGTGDHEAALAVADDFNATHQLGFTWHFTTNPQQCRNDDADELPARPPQQAACGNITDEVYVRAMEEAFAFLHDHSYEPGEGIFVEDEDEPVRSPVEAQHGLPALVKLANWTIAGGQGQAPDDAYALPSPQDRARSQAAQQLVQDRLGEALQATVGPEGEQAVVHYQVGPETELTSRQIGAFANESLEAYAEWADSSGTWEVFTGDNRPRVTVDRPGANAHQGAELDDDLGAVLGVLGAGLFLGAAVVFRDPLAATVATLGVAIVVLSSLGLLGHADVPLSELDLVLAPLVLAAGILFTVPTIEAIAGKAEDAPVGEAIAEAGDEMAFPLSIGGYVAGAGLVTLGLSPLSMAADAAWLGLFGLVVALAVALTFVPAAMALVGTSGRLLSFEEGGPLQDAASGAASRGIAAAVVLALTLASVVGASGLTAEAWGEPTATWPDEDDRRGEHRQALLGFHGLEEGDEPLERNAIVVRGEVTHPQTLAYLDRLAQEVQDQANGTEGMEAVPGRDLPSVIRDWLEVCCGAQSLAQSELPQMLRDADQRADPYPTSQEEVESTLADMLDSPYASLTRGVVAEADGDTVLLPLWIETGDAETAERGWQAANDAVEAAEAERPGDVETAIVGPTANAHLASEDQVPWLGYALLAATGTAALLALSYTRRLTSTLALTLVVGLASVWTLGLIELMDVEFTVATGAGLATGLLVAGALGARRIWPPARHGDTGRAGLFSVVLLVGVLAGVASLLDASAGFPSAIAQDAIQVAVAATGAGYLAQALVARALVPVTAGETDEARVVEAEPESA